MKVAEADLAKANADMANLLAWKRPEEIQQLKSLHQEAEANLARAESEHTRAERLKQDNAALLAPDLSPAHARRYWLERAAEIAESMPQLPNGYVTEESVAQAIRAEISKP